MSDENDKTNQGQGAGQGNAGGTPSQSGPRAPLSLKPRAAGSVSTGTVKQSFSHGRSKTVVVETKRRAGAGGPQRPQGFDVARPQASAQAPRPQGPRPSQPAGGALSAEEQEARRRAIALATQANAAKAAADAAAKAAADAAAREQAAATERAAQAARDEAAAAKAAAEAA
ncbi:translation initiation factor IF-2 associated domain-containing protein, partial [Brevundimonas sp. SH203]|uniref:translation initiation factor IF-2 associated domain-containing protein n=1 Tax=Brevundimonas sp. SH203 TaxID=345167 RepID=UPI00190ED16E